MVGRGGGGVGWFAYLKVLVSWWGGGREDMIPKVVKVKIHRNFQISFGVMLKRK